MVSLARKNTSKKGLNPPQVAFVEALLTEALPIESNSVDCVLSNCVINLLPMEGKAGLLKEVHRILKPGGRVVLDDIVAKKQLPDNILNDLAAYVGCISGAILEEEYKALIKSAGLLDVLFVDTKGDLSIYYQSGDQKSSEAGCCSTPIVPGTKSENPSYDINEWVGSYQIYAMKGMSTLTQTSTSGNVLLRWWDAFPKPISSPASISAEEVATLIRKGSMGSSDFAVIDVRKNDHAGGHVRGSHNAPWIAQTFYSNLPAFFQSFKDTPKVIFYCQSSNGRGPRCAAWYQDYLNNRVSEQPEVNHSNSVAYVLEGGIKNWLAAYGGEMDLIDFD